MLGLLSLLCAVAVQAADVVEINDTDVFDKLLADNKVVMVEFYAPWCGHCKALEPEYEKAAATLKKEGVPAVLAKVDATIEEELATKYDVTGFPTLKLFKQGHKDTEYQGERNEADIVAFLNKKAGPAAVKLTNDKEIQKFKDTYKITVFGFFSSFDGNADWEAFLKMADEDDHPARGWSGTVDAGLKKELEGDGKLARVVAKFGSYDYTGDMAGLGKWVDGHGLPLVSDWDNVDQDRLFSDKVDGQLFAFFDGKAKDNQKDALGKVAENFRASVLFVEVDVTSDEATDLNEYFDVDQKSTTLPCIRMMNQTNSLKYVLAEYDEGDKLNTFIQGVLDGKVAAHYKSETPPERQDTPVYNVVGSTFNHLFRNETQDVLVEFYAPWCGHCKELEPQYEALGKLMAPIDSVLIAKIDYTANEVKGVEIEGFPTIKYYVSGKRDTPLEYDGERTLVGLKQFVVDNASSKIEWPVRRGEAAFNKSMMLVKTFMKAAKMKKDAPDDWLDEFAAKMTEFVTHMDKHVGTDIMSGMGGHAEL